MHGFGPVTPEPNEPVFHAEWERRIFALTLATMGAQRANADELRRTIERIPPATYLTSSYYERWLGALEALLVEKRIVSDGEVDAKIRVDGLSASPPTATPAAAVGAPAQRSNAVVLRHDPRFKARFKPGDRVLARNLNPEGHTRLPRYVRGHRGLIRHDWGTFVFPDTHAHGAGANPQHCYSVEFPARELWGESYSARERVCVDLWEAYLQPATPAIRAAEAPVRRMATAPASPRPRPAAKAARPVVRAAKKTAAAKAQPKPAPAHGQPKRTPPAKTPTIKKASKRTRARRVRKGR
jgi:nitrile hydratase subunit beta